MAGVAKAAGELMLGSECPDVYFALWYCNVIGYCTKSYYTIHIIIRYDTMHYNKTRYNTIWHEAIRYKTRRCGPM